MYTTEYRHPPIHSPVFAKDVEIRIDPVRATHSFGGGISVRRGRESRPSPTALLGNRAENGVTVGSVVQKVSYARRAPARGHLPPKNGGRTVDHRESSGAV